MDFARSTQEAKSRKSHVRSTWLEAEELCQAVIFVSASRVRPSRETFAKHSAWRFFKCDFLTFHPYYICPHYPQMYVRLFREKNPRLVFYNTHTHLLRKNYSSLVRNHYSLFSISLHYHTLRGDLYPNTIHTFLECSECFWSCWEALEEAKDGKCNMELVAGFGELDKTWFREALLELELGGLRYSG